MDGWGEGAYFKPHTTLRFSAQIQTFRKSLTSGATTINYNVLNPSGMFRGTEVGNKVVSTLLEPHD